MSHSIGPHHNILKGSLSRLKRPRRSLSTAPASREDGYTLVALLAVMTIIALFAAAAAPSIRQQAQRERELETIFRGEEVAEGIRLYYSYQVRQKNLTGEAGLPTSVEQMLEGVGTKKKVQILRASAARNPLSQDG